MTLMRMAKASLKPGVRSVDNRAMGYPWMGVDLMSALAPEEVSGMSKA
jgi:hypothetical protein